MQFGNVSVVSGLADLVQAANELAEGQALPDQLNSLSTQEGELGPVARALLAMGSKLQAAEARYDGLLEVAEAADDLAAGQVNLVQLEAWSEEAGHRGQTAQALLAAGDWMHWYDAMLDAIPFPISVIANQMAWTYINAAAMQVTGRQRSEVLGMPCRNWGADICNTDRCGIVLWRKGMATSTFSQPGLERDFRVDRATFPGRDGQQVGHIEVVQDVTPTST